MTPDPALAQLADIAAGPATLLFVDDEENILSSLKRLFRPHGYAVLTATSGARGLELLGQHPVDLVISDMRMPEMDGAQFLERVRRDWPDAVRILLTGYADISSTVAAINRGEIYRYISKPWEDNDVVLVAKQALERKMLEREKKRLEDLTERQNLELRELNAGLENKVRERTEALRQAMASLQDAHDKLKKGFLTSVKVFSNLIELREGTMAGHSRRVAEHARKMAQRLGLNDAEAQDVTLAALLHDIGKFGLPDRLFNKPFTSLNSEERAEMVKHPAKGQAALMALEQLSGAAKLIRSHHERYDGMGYPDGLSGLAIPLGARILAVANDYDALQIGSLVNNRHSPTAALRFIVEARGKRYDPIVVDTFAAMLGGVSQEHGGAAELELTASQLRSGMMLSRDLVSREGILLLARDYMLDDSLIGQIKAFEQTEGITIKIHVRASMEEALPPHL